MHKNQNAHHTWSAELVSPRSAWVLLVIWREKPWPTRGPCIVIQFCGSNVGACRDWCVERLPVCIIPLFGTITSWTALGDYFLSLIQRLRLTHPLLTSILFIYFYWFDLYPVLLPKGRISKVAIRCPNWSTLFFSAPQWGGIQLPVLGLISFFQYRMSLTAQSCSKLESFKNGRGLSRDISL